MFGRKPSAATIIGAATVFQGAIECGDDDLHIEGKVRGTIASNASVSLGSSGFVQGDITAASVSVGGKVEGVVVAREQLHMLGGGHIKGDAYYGTLEVERGGVIEGRTMANVAEAPALPAATMASPRPGAAAAGPATPAPQAVRPAAVPAPATAPSPTAGAPTGVGATVKSPASAAVPSTTPAASLFDASPSDGGLGLASVMQSDDKTAASDADEKSADESGRSRADAANKFLPSKPPPARTLPKLAPPKPPTRKPAAKDDD